MLFAVAILLILGGGIGGSATSNVIRRYLRRIGGAPMGGANADSRSWAAWQQCRDYAKARSDPQGLHLVRSFIVCEILFWVGVLLLLASLMAHYGSTRSNPGGSASTIPYKRSNQAMQLTASKPVVYAGSVCRRERMLRLMHRGLAAADLVSR
jgi:hypothetical protein